LGMKQGLEGQTRAQRQGDFPVNLNGIHQPFGLIHHRPFPKEV
jgi:hypothetical protein